MGKFLLRRILAVVPVLLIVAVIVFSLLRMTPGDPAAAIAGESATPEDIAQIRAALGLDRSIWMQFAIWMGHLLHGNLGYSYFYKMGVAQLIEQRLEPTISIAVVTILLTVLIAVPAGLVAAARRDRALDRIVMGASVMGFSIPVFVIAYVLIWLFAMKLNWLPPQGYSRLADGIGPWIERLILPCFGLAIVYAALIARITRTAVSEALTEDYIRTARAKGISGARTLLRHALANAAVPIVTIIGLSIASLIGGVVITETIFAIPGLGRLTVDAVLSRDYPVIQGVTLFFSVIYVGVNLLVDLSYLLLDPRIRY